MNNIDIAQIMWGVLAGAWGIATLIRLVLTWLSWPDQRKRRVYAALAHAIFCGYFCWRMTQPSPPELLTADLIRNGANFFFVTWTILDGIWGVYGMAERRAQLIKDLRGTP